MSDTYSLKQVVKGHCIDARYVIEDQIGSGGMSVVYSARHIHLGRMVAIKFIRPDILGSGNAQQRFPERFQREGRAMSLIEHPNCIRIFDLGELGNGTQFMVMEYFPSVTLADLLDDAPEGFEPRYMIELAIQLARALVAVHKANVTHYDLKPENVLVGKGPDGEDLVKLLDFGIAKIRSSDVDETASGSSHLWLVPPKQPLTIALSVLGTPEYMSPEAAKGMRISAHADLYSIGAVFFHMLTGVTPYQASEDELREGGYTAAMSVMSQHVHAPIPSVLDVKKGIDPALAHLVQQLMAKKPEERPTAVQLLAALEKIRAQLLAPPQVPVVQKIRSATIAFVGKVHELDRELGVKVAQKKIATSETGDLGTPGYETMAFPSFVERWGPWFKERLRAARIPLLASAVLLVSVWIGSAMKRSGVHVTDVAGVEQSREESAVDSVPSDLPLVTAPSIPSRDLDDAAAQQAHRGIEVYVPSYDPPPQVAVVAEVVDPVVLVPQPLPEVVVEPPKVPPVKPKPQPKKVDAAQLFQQASAAFAADNVKKACVLAKRAIAAADSAKANAFRRAASRFGCGSL